MRGSVDSYDTSAGRRWRIRWDLPPDPDTDERRRGQRRGFESKRAAEKALTEELGRVESGVYVPPSRASLAEYLRQWLDGIRVKPTTHANYRQSAEVHAIPRIGGVKLQALTPEHLDGLYRELERHGKRAGDCRTAGVTCKENGCSPDRHDGLAPKTVRHVHTMLRKALQDAARRGHVLRNVADLSNPPSQKQARSRQARDKAWTGDQLGTFLDHVDGDRLYPVWHLLATTGLRRAEVLGLRWDHVDLDAGRLRVVETVTVADGVRIEDTSAKTDAGERAMSLDGGTVAVLRSWRQRQLEERMHAGPAWVDTGGRLVTNVDGSPIQPGRLSHLFSDASDAAALPRIGVHGLRHSYATVSLRAGVSPEVLSKRLGHADVAITLSIYAHVLQSDDQAAADVAAAAIRGPRAGAS